MHRGSAPSGVARSVAADEDSGVLAGDSLLRNIQNDMRSANGSAINGYEGGPYYLSNLGVKTNRDGTLTFADADALERTFKSNANSILSFFKDQIVSDNAAIAPLRYSIADTTPGSYAVSVSSGSATIGGVSASASGIGSVDNSRKAVGCASWADFASALVGLASIGGRLPVFSHA